MLCFTFGCLCDQCSEEPNFYMDLALARCGTANFYMEIHGILQKNYKFYMDRPTGFMIFSQICIWTRIWHFRALSGVLQWCWGIWGRLPPIQLPSATWCNIDNDCRGFFYHTAHQCSGCPINKYIGIILPYIDVVQSAVPIWIQLDRSWLSWSKPRQSLSIPIVTSGWMESNMASFTTGSPNSSTLLNDHTNLQDWSPLPMCLGFTVTLLRDQLKLQSIRSTDCHDRSDESISGPPSCNIYIW